MTRNGHTETPVIANGLANGESYYVTLFPIAADGAVNTNEANHAVGEADKMQGGFTLSKTEVVLNASTLSNSVTVSKLGDGAVTAESSNTGITTVEVSGNVVTVHHVNLTTGVATITVHVAEGEDYKAAQNQTFTVNAQFMPTKKALNDQTWAEIRQVSDANKGSEYWNVGDRKAVLVNGTVGTQSINQTLYVYILGFNHNSAKEGNGIQFGTFKTALSGGTDVVRFKQLWNEVRKELQDNDSGTWSEEARTWAVSTGLVAGNGTEVNGEPNYMWADVLTREQMAVLLYRFAKMMGKA